LRVLVAAGSLPPGTILERTHLVWQDWPAGGNVEGYFTEAASKPEELVGAVVRHGLAQGAPLTRDGVIQPGDRSFLAAVLRPGYRAVSVAVSASTGVSGFIRPGDRVDVILSRVSQGGANPSVATDTILSGVRVVGVDQRVSSETSEVVVPETATLEVTRSQAEAIAAASELGKLSLALRSVAAANDDPPEGMSVAPFWREGSSPASAAAPVAAHSAARARESIETEPQTTTALRTVEVVRGMNTSVEAIAN
jgi:pilus assembly protein CpaB